MSQVKKLLKIHNMMSQPRTNWDSHWRDMATFVVPNKDDVFEWKSKSVGEEKFNQLYDGSAEHFNELLASALHSMLTNQASRWFELTTGDPEINKIPEVKAYLQKLVVRMHELLNNSNFHTEIHEVYIDLGSFGTAVLLIEEDEEDEIRFKSRPIYELYIREDARGRVDGISSVEEMTVEQAFKEYGMEKFGEAGKQLKGDLSKKIEIVQLVLPRFDRKFEGIGPKNFEYASYHIWEKGEVLLKESGMNEFPAAVPRWIKMTGEVYGRSPAMKALPDVRMLNAMAKTTIRAAQKIVDPPLMVPDDGMMGRVNTRPGGLNSYRAGSPDRIFPLETRGNIPIGIEMMNMTRQRVKEAFFIDQLQLKDGPQMTATEVDARTQDNLRLLSPILGRQNSELLKPMISRVLGIMKRRKLLPEGMPEPLKKVSLEVFYSSQIARAQRISDANTLQAYMGSIAPLVEIDPSVYDLYEPSEIARELGTLYGVPERIFREDEDVKKIREQRAKEQEAATKNQQELDDSEKVKNAGPSLVAEAQQGA